MTRKDYQRIAEAIRQSAPKETAPMDRYRSIERRISQRIADDFAERIARRLADVFAEDNPRFDRERFLSACGFGS